MSAPYFTVGDLVAEKAAMDTFAIELDTIMAEIGIDEDTEQEIRIEDTANSIADLMQVAMLEHGVELPNESATAKHAELHADTTRAELLESIKELIADLLCENK